jgi:hypothetical protein
MPKSDPDRLAAALRENLRKRKSQARGFGPEPSFGTDEEGDMVMPLSDEGQQREPVGRKAKNN